MKSSLFAWVVPVALLAAVPSPAAAGLDPLVGPAFAGICLPYARRSATLEHSIAKARAMDFRRPVADQAPLEEWASEVDLVSDDGRWRLHLEEGSADASDGRSFYQLTCTLSARMASLRELTALADYGFGNDPRWRRTADAAPRWDRITARPQDYSLSVRVGDRDPYPVLAAVGEYY